MQYKIKFEVYNRFDHLIKDEITTAILNNPTVSEIKSLYPTNQYGNINSEVFIANGGRNDLVDLDIIDQPWVKYVIKLN